MTEAAYRTADPGILASYQALVAGTRAYLEAVRAFLEAEGLGDYEVLSWEDRRFAGLKIRPVPGGEPWREEPPPAGWRRDSRHERYTPDRRTKKGRLVQATLDELGKRHPGSLLSVLRGMPTRSFPSANRHQTPGVWVPLAADCLYVHWNDDPELVSEWTGTRAADPVDHDIWDRILLSEYHAAKEADEDARKEKEEVSS